MADLALYGGLFLTAFVAATLLPAGSEAAFAALLAAESGDPVVLFFCAVTGNTLGACLNWWLGLKALHFQNRRWVPFSAEQIDKASKRFKRYGSWSLLFAWLPVVGDPLTFIAGSLRIRFALFLPLVLAGKAGRYAVIWLGVAAVTA